MGSPGQHSSPGHMQSTWTEAAGATIRTHGSRCHGIRGGPLGWAYLELCTIRPPVLPHERVARWPAEQVRSDLLAKVESNRQ